MAAPRKISAASARAHTRRNQNPSSFQLPPGILRKLSLLVLVVVVAWTYQVIKPPSSKICGSVNGPPITSSRIELKDGRHLSYAEHGLPKDKAKYKIIFIHGIDSCKYDVFPVSQDVIEGLGIYILSFDRAGYGESDPNPKQSEISTTLDVEELANSLELGKKFYVIGHSFGGEFTWATLKYLSNRLAGAAIVAPISNYWWPGFPANISKEAFKGQLVQDQWAYRVSHYAPWLAYWWNTQNLFPASSVITNLIDDLSARDKGILAMLSTKDHKIRLESKGGRNSSIMFCTNGILIRLLIGRGSNSSKAKPQSKSKMDCLQGITHIIVDEIHERDRFSDFMLAIIRDLLPSYPHLRMVLMSATIDADKFSKYFNGCPIIQVPGFTFPVKKLYLEDVLSMLNSADGNHLHHGTADYVKGESSLDDEYKGALDDSINFALTNDEFDPLLQLVSAKQNPIIYNYQHSSTGVSPLMVFAGKGRISDVSMLLSFGADCSLLDRDGRSALDWAQLSNDIQVYEIVKQQMEKNVSRSTGDELLHKYLASTNTEQIDTVLIERLLKYICNSSSEGAILVFLPGWDDINQTKERLFASSYFQDQSRFLVLSLHSMIPSIEQKKVFKRPPVGVRKIILSTNIAETAVTIDDIVYVIDSGRMKVKSYDPYNNVSTLQSSWVSKANARQREGRAGRCQAGICYHLYSKVRAASLPEYQIPEIKRTPIEELCLQIKLLDPSCQIMDFLQKTLDPPVSEAVHNAVRVLKDIGALTHDEGLTDLGQKLGSLPVHPSTSKMLLFAILLNCLDPALTLACAADYREPFLLPMFPDERKRASIAKVELASLYGGYSDQLAVVAAYDCWRRAKERGQESQFCSQYFISSNTMSMLHGMRKQLQNELAKKGFIPADISMCSLNAHDPGILRAVLMAGSYPMVGRFLPQRKNTKGTYVETANGTKVRLHAHSSNFGLCSRSSAGGPLIVYDEITRGDSGMYIRNCSVINPYPLLLIASEMVVAPANDDSENDEDEYSLSLEEDEMETNVSSGQHAEEIMSSPDNFVSVVVDRWLNFKATALDVAQIYCLRERLYSAILFKVKYPDAVLPPALGASMYAIACSLSFDVLPSMVTSGEIVEQQISTVTPIGNNELQSKGKKSMGYCPASTFLQSLFFGNGHSPSNSKMKASSNCSASLPSSKSFSLGDKSNLQKSQASGDIGSAVRSSKRRR